MRIKMEWEANRLTKMTIVQIIKLSTVVKTENNFFTAGAGSDDEIVESIAPVEGIGYYLVLSHGTNDRDCRLDKDYCQVLVNLKDVSIRYYEK